MSQSDKVSKSVGKLSVTSGSVKLGNTSGALAQKIPAPTALGNATATLTAAQLFSRIGTSTPGAAASFTTPTAAALVAFQAGVSVGDSYELTVINLSGANAITLVPGSGVTLVGSDEVATSSSGNFIIRFSNVTSSSEAVVIYRV